MQLICIVLSVHSILLGMVWDCLNINRPQIFSEALTLTDLCWPVGVCNSECSASRADSLGGCGQTM